MLCQRSPCRQPAAWDRATTLAPGAESSDLPRSHPGLPPETQEYPMRSLSTRLVMLTVAVPLMLGAQTTPPPPPYNVLTVFRETVKPGKRVAHNAHEVAWANANIAAKNPI